MGTGTGVRSRLTVCHHGGSSLLGGAAGGVKPICGPRIARLSPGGMWIGWVGSSEGGIEIRRVRSGSASAIGYPNR